MMAAAAKMQRDGGCRRPRGLPPPIFVGKFDGAAECAFYADTATARLCDAYIYVHAADDEGCAPLADCIRARK